MIANFFLARSSSFQQHKINVEETALVSQTTEYFTSPMPTHSDLSDATASVDPLSPDFSPPLPDSSADASSNPQPGNSQAGTIDNSGNSNPACFPSDTTVELIEGGLKPMSELRIGDVVRVSATEFSPVIVFSHRNTVVTRSDFITLTTSVSMMNDNAASTSLTLSSGHLVYVQRKGIIPADWIQTGDFVQVVVLGNRLQPDQQPNQQWSKVQRVVHNVTKTGLFNPHTVNGDIVVNQIVTSCYTNAIKNRDGLAKSLSAHGLLTPIRALFHVGMLSERTMGRLWRDGII